jgi:aminopeptidase N
MIRIRGFCWAVLLAAGLLLVWGDVALAQQRSGRRLGAPGQPPAAVPATATPAPVAAPAAAPVEPLRTAVDRPIDIRDIRLELRADLPKKTIEGMAILQLRALREVKNIELDAGAFKVKGVSLTTNGKEEPSSLPYMHDGKKLTVLIGRPWTAGQEATLRVDYRVENPKEGLHFFGPSKDEPEAPLTVWSQGEPISNHYWFPCIDAPDQRQTTEVVVTVPEGFEAISNGKLLSRKSNPDSKTVTFDWRQDKQHPAYLVTLVIGQFDVVREEWDRVPVLYYVPKGSKDKVTTTFARTRDMLGFFSKRFGIHYPWDKYAQVVAYSFGGGMENTSATTMGDILQDERSSLERDSDGIIAHELAHQWWGDLVTCRDWSHLWLNEGFASYAEALWDENRNGPDAYDYNMYQKAHGGGRQNAITGGKDRPIVDRRYPTPGSMFDGRSYPKGAWVLHMLRRRVGEDAFWKAIQAYGSEHRLQGAETSDFRRALERTSGRNLERFFYDWTERAGSPILDVTTELVPSARQARLVVKQTQPGEPFHFPLTVRLHCAGVAKPIVLEQDVTDRQYTLVVPVPGTPSLVEVDPEQTMLGEIKETKGRELWAAQLLRGSSVAERLRAVAHFRESKADEDRDLLADALAEEKFWGVQNEIASALAAVGGDKAREALLQGAKHANPRVRRACMDNLAKLPKNAQVAEAALGVLSKDEPSYAVCGAAMLAYVKHGGKDAVAVLTPWLSRPSHNDLLRGAALRALAETHDLAMLDSLLKYAKPGNSQATRMGALQGLVQLALNAKPNAAQTKKIVGVFTSGLEGDNRRMQFMVLAAVRDAGPLASALLPALEKVSRDAADERIRTMARTTTERIRAAEKPATAAASDEVKKLREEVERLKKEQTELRDRLQKIEQAKSK